MHNRISVGHRGQPNGDYHRDRHHRRTSRDTHCQLPDSNLCIGYYGVVSMITQDRLKEVLCYNPETGFFFWRVAKAQCIQIGSLAGNTNMYGYWAIKIDKKTYLAHRLAWLHEYGRFPKGSLDHINRIRTDCRIANLREATSEQNMANRKAQRSRSNLKGVAWKKSYNRWSAQIKRNHKRMHLGYFDTAEEAHAAWCEVAKQFDGEFFFSGASQ